MNRRRARAAWAAIHPDGPAVVLLTTAATAVLFLYVWFGVHARGLIVALGPG